MPQTSESCLSVEIESGWIGLRFESVEIKYEMTGLETMTFADVDVSNVTSSSVSVPSFTT